MLALRPTPCNAGVAGYASGYAAVIMRRTFVPWLALAALEVPAPASLARKG